MGCPCRLFFRFKELVHARLERAVFVDLAVDQSLGSDLWALHPIGQGIQLLARVVRTSWCYDSEHGFSIVKDAEPLALCDRSEVDELHAEAHVGLVASVALHGLVVRHARERIDFDVEDGFEEVAHEVLKRLQHVFLLHKGHLAVNLREFRLAIRAEVFVAEALDDLVVAVVSADHQQLLERLRALRQRVKLPGVHARRHDKVPCTFRCGLDQIRRLNFDELHPVEVLAGLDAQPVAEHEVALYGLAAQVEVTELHPQIVAAIGIVFDGKRRGLAGIQDVELGDFDFDVPGGHLGVFGFTDFDESGRLNDEFAAELASAQAEGFVRVHVEGQLGQAVAVTDVDKGHSTQVAGALNPTAQGDGLACVVGAQFAASMRSMHGS